MNFNWPPIPPKPNHKTVVKGRWTSCVRCGFDFLAAPRTSPKYCTKVCYLKAKTKRNREIYRRNIKRRIKVCPQCHSEFYASRMAMKYCSKACNDKNRSARDAEKYLRNRTLRLAQMKARRERLLAEDSEGYREKIRERERVRRQRWSADDLERRRMIKKVSFQWKCTAVEARRMIESGSFPP